MLARIATLASEIHSSAPDPTAAAPTSTCRARSATRTSKPPAAPSVAVQQRTGLPAVGSLQGFDLGAEPDVDVTAAQHGCQFGGYRRVLAADQLRGDLHEGHRHAESGVRLSKLTADSPATQDHQRRG